MNPNSAANLIVLSKKLADMFEKYSGISFSGGKKLSLITRFCGPMNKNARRELCKWFTEVDYSTRLQFIMQLSNLLMPHLIHVITTRPGTLTLAHTRPGGENDRFKYPVDALAIGEVFNESYAGSLVMNPFTALLMYIENDGDPKPGTHGFAATFVASDPKPAKNPRRHAMVEDAVLIN